MSKGIIILNPKTTKKVKGRLTVWTVDSNDPVRVGDKVEFDDLNIDGYNPGDVVEFRSAGGGQWSITRVIDPRGLGNFKGIVNNLDSGGPLTGGTVKITNVTEANPFGVTPNTDQLFAYTFGEGVDSLSVGGTVDCVPVSSSACVITNATS